MNGRAGGVGVNRWAGTIAVVETVPPPPDFSLAVLEQCEADLVGVDAAIVRLDDRTFGYCGACGAVIGDVTLAGDPLADCCGVHAAAS